MRPVVRFRYALAVVVLATLGTGRASRAETRPPLPEGSAELTPGQIPAVCPAGSTVDTTGPTLGHYFSEAKNAWVAAPWCYPRWGNLEASASQVVRAGATVTMTATPTEGSNSAQYAPETKSIAWAFPGTVVSGCGNADLQCTVTLPQNTTAEWKWFQFKVTMPRTFFIDSKGSNCAGQRVCAGFATHAWTFAGVAPDPGAASPPYPGAPSYPGEGEGCGTSGIAHRARGAGGAASITALLMLMALRRRRA